MNKNIIADCSYAKKNNRKNKIIKFHLRGGIDYAKLNFAHKTIMKLLYNAIKNIPEEKQTAENKAMIETYNKKVDFIDFSSLDEIIHEIQK